MHLIDDIFPTLLEIMPSLISPRSFVLLVADERKLLQRQKRSIYHLFFPADAKGIHGPWTTWPTSCWCDAKNSTDRSANMHNGQCKKVDNKVPLGNIKLFFTSHCSKVPEKLKCNFLTRVVIFLSWFMEELWLLFVPSVWCWHPHLIAFLTQFICCPWVCKFISGGKSSWQQTDMMNCRVVHLFSLHIKSLISLDICMICRMHLPHLSHIYC